MTNYTIWADRGAGDQKVYDVAKALRKASGSSVKVLGIGPGIGQNYGLSRGKGTTGIFITNGVGFDTPEDMEKGIERGYYKYDHVIFVWPQYIGNQYMTDSSITSHIVPTEHDIGSAQGVGGKKTAAQYFPTKKHVSLVSGTSPEDIAQRIANGSIVTSSGNPASTSNTSGDTMTVNSNYSNPMLAGDKSFEDIIKEICDGTDILFLVKKNHILVTDFEQIYADALVLRQNGNYNTKDEDINLWQLEDGSYQLNVDQFGFYNAVIVYYSGGKIYEQYDDLVDVYGVQVKVYNDKKLTKTQAQAKAKAYLAAHVRDFNMQVQANILGGDIDVGDIVTLKNPMSYHKKKDIPEYLFTSGISIEWDGDYLVTDLELKYGPESPERPEIPTSGTGKVSSSDSSSYGSDINSGGIEIGNDLASKYKFNYSSSSYCGMRSTKGGDCHAWSAALWSELKNNGFAVRIVEYATSMSSNHWSVQYKSSSGNWEDYPYRDTNIPKLAYSTSNSKNGRVVIDENGLGSGSSAVC